MRRSDFIAAIILYLCGCALWFAAYAWVMHRPRLGDLAGAVAIVAIVLAYVTAFLLKEDEL